MKMKHIHRPKIGFRLMLVLFTWAAWLTLCCNNLCTLYHNAVVVCFTMPLKKSMLTYATLWTLADFNEQKFFSKKQHYDIMKTVRNTTVGTFVIAPLVYNWLILAEKLFPGTTVRAVIKKTVTSNMVFGPVATSCFFVATNVLERRGDIAAEWKEKFPKTFMTALCYWPFVTAANYRYVAPAYRMYVVGCASFLWSTFLCFVKESNVHPVQSLFSPLFRVTAEEEEKTLPQDMQKSSLDR